MEKHIDTCHIDSIEEIGGIDVGSGSGRIDDSVTADIMGDSLGTEGQPAAPKQAAEAEAAPPETESGQAAEDAPSERRTRKPMPPEERSRYAAARRKAEEERDRVIARVRHEEMQSRARYELREQLREINAIDPSVQTIEDILTRPTGARFEELVQRGNTLTDAFRLANIDELTYAAARAARQEVLASVSSKEHMRRSTSRGQGAAAVPREVAQQYRILYPKASDEEIARHYNEYING